MCIKEWGARIVRSAATYDKADFSSVHNNNKPSNDAEIATPPPPTFLPWLIRLPKPLLLQEKANSLKLPARFFFWGLFISLENHFFWGGVGVCVWGGG